MTKQKIFLFAAASALFSASALADEVKCRDGSVYIGEITEISGGVISLASASDNAGTTKIKQSEVVSVSTEKPVFVRTPDKNTVLGKIVPAENGRLRIDGGSVSAELDVPQLAGTWRQGDMSPEEKLLANKWSYALGASLLGKTGNTESITLGISSEAVRKTTEDVLKFYANYNYGKTKDTNNEWSKSADDLHCGVDYSVDIVADIFAYAREDLGFDRAKNIRFLSTSAAGLGYKIINDSDWHLSFRAGISYRYETYKDYMHDGSFGDPDDTSAIGMDFGLHHDYHWSWGYINTDITYTPTFEDFTGDYIIEHETYVDFKVDGVDNMDVRIGVKNEYRAQTSAKEHLDTTYYAKVVFSWK